MIYFDNAATSFPKPGTVLPAVERAIRHCGGNPGRGAHPLAAAAAEEVYNCREEVAGFFGTSAPENVIFCQNATAALNLAIKTRIRPGMHVLLSDREHNAVFRPIFRLASEGLCTYSFFPTDGDIPNAIRASLRKETRMLVCTQISNVTGKALPIEKIGALCRETGIYFIIDAAQSAGHMPISLEKIAYDAFCAPGHKGLFGIPGSGFCILRDGTGLSTYAEGGSGVESLSPEMPKRLPERYEAGTVAVPAIASLAAGIREVKRYGPAAIEEKETELKNELAEALSLIPGIRLYEPENRGGVLSFTHERVSPEEIGRALAEENICVRSGFHCAPLAHRTIGTEEKGTVRASLGIFNTRREVSFFAGTLSRILRGR